MATIRRAKALWNDVSTGAGGASGVGRMGAATVATLFVKVDGATDITIEVSPGTEGAGINDFDMANMVWYPLWEDDLSAASKITFAGAGKAAVDLSPIAAEFIRLVSSNNVTATAHINYVSV